MVQKQRLGGYTCLQMHYSNLMWLMRDGNDINKWYLNMMVKNLSTTERKTKHKPSQCNRNFEFEGHPCCIKSVVAPSLYIM